MLVQPVLGHFVKQPHERFEVSVDWTLRLSEGETLTRVEAAAVDAKTLEPADVIDGAVLDGVFSKVTVARGQHGHLYRITVRVTTSTAAVHEADLYMHCEEY